MNITRIGATAVPYTVSWTSENAEFVGICPVARRKALCMPSSPGIGKPHAIRQREAISNGLCDLCGKSLKLRTKVSLSHARVNEKGADGPAVLQVEPLLHRECALESMKFCPSLKRDIAAGTLMVRSVTRYRVQFAIMGPQYIKHYVPDYIENPNDRIIGHAKVELLSWVDRDADWLGATP